MSLKKPTKKELLEIKKNKETLFRKNLFDDVQKHFKEKYIDFRFVVKRTNLDERVKLTKFKKETHPWINDLKNHDLSFRILIQKNNIPFINVKIFSFLNKIYDIMKSENIEEDINNSELVKSYFPLVEIYMV